MNVNKSIKIVIIIAILIIINSYYQSLISTQQRQQEDKFLSYKIKFQEDCDEKYDKVKEETQEKEKENQQKLVMMEKLVCKLNPQEFNIDSLFYCDRGLPYVNSRDRYISYCIEWKTKQIGL